MSEVLLDGKEQGPSPRDFIVAEWERVIVPEVQPDMIGVARTFREEILTAYEEPNRRHHGLSHIDYCLHALQPYQERPDYLQLWFALLSHDEIYDTRSRHNEEDSAQIAFGRMRLLRFPGPYTVFRLIMATKGHVPQEEDEALVCDIDMSILAAPEPVYDAYAAAIRQEYDWVDDEQQYRQGRIKFLSGIGTVFHHPDFQHLESQAHANIQRELLALSA